MPNMTIQAGRALVHHTLGNGEFDLFRKWQSLPYVPVQL